MDNKSPWSYRRFVEYQNKILKENNFPSLNYFDFRMIPNTTIRGNFVYCCEYISNYYRDSVIGRVFYTDNKFIVIMMLVVNVETKIFETEEKEAEYKEDTEYNFYHLLVDADFDSLANSKELNAFKLSDRKDPIFFIGQGVMGFRSDALTMLVSKIYNIPSSSKR